MNESKSVHRLLRRAWCFIVKHKWIWWFDETKTKQVFCKRCGFERTMKNEVR